MHEVGVRVEVLGEVRARFVDSGDEIPLGPPRQRGLFAMLALNAGRVVTTQELIDGMWGAAAPDAAHGSIHTYVSGLRRVLPPVLDRTGGGYLLRLDGEAVDAIAAETGLRTARQLPATPETATMLDECLRLFRGTPLSEVAGPFADTERQRLTELRLGLVEERADVLLALGRHAEVRADLAVAVREAPLRERLRGLLVLALHREGRQAEALAEYDDIAALLAERLGIDPGTELRALRQQITAHEAGPAQLPGEATGFVGRGDELDTLTAWSGERGTLVISAIDGAAGIGKTALAVRFAHHVKERFPDGQLYVDLRGYDPKGAPLSATEALTGLLRGLGAEQLAADEQAQAALYRSMMAGKHALVLLDNAFSVDQVRPLLPGTAGSLVVITSRNQLRGLVVRDGARRLTLDVLTPQEAIEVLCRAIGRHRIDAEPEAAAELARLCGHLPLALRVAGERSAFHPDLTLRERVDELAGEQDRLDVLAVDDDDMSSVRAVFSWSYRALKPELAEAFRRLGLHPGADFDAPAAAALVGVPVRRAGELLTGLVSRCLLEQTAPRRYRFHDLLRVYAAELAAAEESPEEVDAAVVRMLAWYVDTSLSALSVTNPGGSAAYLGSRSAMHPELKFDDGAQAIAWYETEAANISALAVLAFESAHDELAWQQSWSLFPYYYSSGLLTEWISLLRTGLAAAERSGDQSIRAKLLNQLSIAYSRTGRNDLAVEALETALRLCPPQGEHKLRSSLLGNLGSTLREAGRHAEGLAPVLEALQIAHEIGDDYYVAGALDTLCELYVELGRYDEALRTGEEGLRTAGREDRLMEANLLVNVGHARRNTGDTEGAAESYDAAIAVSRSVSDRYHEALALFGVARMNGSRAAAEQALELFEKLDAEEAAVVRDFLGSGDPGSGGVG